jgi:IS5 family transposase
MSLGKRNLQAVLGPSLDDLVDPEHEYRAILAAVPFTELCAPLKKKYSDLGRGGYPAESMFKALIIQWDKDLSYRELEKELKENLAAKLFCGFQLTDQTPDYSTLCEFSLRVGTNGLSVLFRDFREGLKSAGLVREVFTFIDSTHIISKSNLWRERDILLEAGKGKLGNLNVSSVAADPQARFGRKGKTKWYGFKQHVGIDMTHGFITRVTITAANVEDTKAAKHVMPKQGMVFGDKAYGVGASAYEMRRRGLKSGAILKNGMKEKNPDKDKWLCRVRMPFEGYFSKVDKHARYRGIERNQFQGFMQAIVHNVKLLVRIAAPPLIIGPNYA